MESDKRFRWGTLAACTVAMAATLGPSADAGEAQTVSQISRYCQTSWRNAGISPQEWDDCTQQVLAELLDTIPGELCDTLQAPESPEHRELKRAVWRTIKRHQRRPRTSPLPNDELGQADAEVSHEHESAWEEVHSVASKCLNDQQWRVLEMSRDGWSVSDIAQDLGIAPSRVSDAKYRAIGKLKAELAGHA